MLKSSSIPAASGSLYASKGSVPLFGGSQKDSSNINKGLLQEIEERKMISVSDDLLKRLVALEADSKTIIRHLEKLSSQLTGQEAHVNAVSTVCTSIVSMVTQQMQLFTSSTAAQQAQMQKLQDSITVQQQGQVKHQMEISRALAEQHSAIKRLSNAAMPAAHMRLPTEQVITAPDVHQAGLNNILRTIASPPDVNQHTAPQTAVPSVMPSQQAKQTRITAMFSKNTSATNIPHSRLPSPELLHVSHPSSAGRKRAAVNNRSGSSATAAAAAAAAAEPGQWQSKRPRSSRAAAAAAAAPAPATCRRVSADSASKHDAGMQSTSPSPVAKQFQRPSARTSIAVRRPSSAAAKPPAAAPAVGAKRSPAAAELMMPASNIAMSKRQHSSPVLDLFGDRTKSRPQAADRAQVMKPAAKAAKAPASSVYDFDDDDIAAKVAARMSQHRARRAQKMRSSQSQLL
jgi:hypothetical protein